VVDVGRGHGELSGGEQGGWAGREEACLTDHGFYSNESALRRYGYLGCQENSVTFVPCRDGAGGRDC
jgi:hypothetical protein